MRVYTVRCKRMTVSIRESSMETAIRKWMRLNNMDDYTLVLGLKGNFTVTSPGSGWKLVYKGRAWCDVSHVEYFPVTGEQR